MPASTAQSCDCPSWCQREHLGTAEDPCGFHHDGLRTTVALDDSVVVGRAESLYVNVSQHEQGGLTSERAYVEIQDDLRTLALLTPAECVRLSRALLEGAALIREQDPTLDVWLGPLTADLENTLKDWLPTLARRLQA